MQYAPCARYSDVCVLCVALRSMHGALCGAQYVPVHVAVHIYCAAASVQCAACAMPCAHRIMHSTLMCASALAACANTYAF